MLLLELLRNQSKEEHASLKGKVIDADRHAPPETRAEPEEDLSDANVPPAQPVETSPPALNLQHPLRRQD